MRENRRKRWHRRESRARLMAPGIACFAGSARSLMLRLALVAGLGVGMNAGWPWLRAYIMYHPYFALGEIQVNTGQRLTPKEVIYWSRVVKGTSLWEVSPTEVEQRLVTHPWIRAAYVQRKLPQSLAITVIERQPVAILADGSFTYLDETGEIITRLTDTDNWDFPYVAGTPAVLGTAEAVKQVPEMLALIGQSGWPDPVSEVHLDPAGELSLFLSGHQITIILTREGWQEQIPHLAAVLRRWHNQESRPALMDARFVGQIIVRPGQRSKGVEEVWRGRGAQEQRSRGAEDMKRGGVEERNFLCTLAPLYLCTGGAGP